LNEDNSIVHLRQPNEINDPLTALLRSGARISAIARALAVSRQKVERWLKSGGPATHDKPAQPRLLDSWFEVLEQRWHEGCRNGTRLRRELRDQALRSALPR
jgi:transposase